MPRKSENPLKEVLACRMPVGTLAAIRKLPGKPVPNVWVRELVMAAIAKRRRTGETHEHHDHAATDTGRSGNGNRS